VRAARAARSSAYNSGKVKSVRDFMVAPFTYAKIMPGARKDKR
jgi:hypothetical protein